MMTLLTLSMKRPFELGHGFAIVAFLGHGAMARVAGDEIAGVVARIASQFVSTGRGMGEVIDGHWPHPSGIAHADQHVVIRSPMSRIAIGSGPVTGGAAVARHFARLGRVVARSAGHAKAFLGI
jgi:hypothetical protein